MGMANTISDLSFSPVLSGPNNSAIVRAKKRCFLEEILYSRFYPLRSSLLRRRTINIARNHLFLMSFSIYISLSSPPDGRNNTQFFERTAKFFERLAERRSIGRGNEICIVVDTRENLITK